LLYCSYFVWYVTYLLTSFSWFVSGTMVPGFVCTPVRDVRKDITSTQYAYSYGKNDGYCVLHIYITKNCQLLCFNPHQHLLNTTKQLGRNDPGPGADRPGADRLWGGSTGTQLHGCIQAWPNQHSVRLRPPGTVGICVLNHWLEWDKFVRSTLTYPTPDSGLTYTYPDIPRHFHDLR